MAIFKLPELGEGLSEGEVISWRVKEGDDIKADSTMVEIMTDKATVEVPAPRSGRVTKLYYQPGQLAKVGAPLIDIEESSAATVGKSRAEESSGARPSGSVNKADALPGVGSPTQASASAASKQVPEQVRSGDTRVLASPAIRKLAREQNVDLQSITGSGERGRILKSDLETAFQVGRAVGRASSLSLVPSADNNSHTLDVSQSRSSSPSATSHLEERIPFIGMRRKIADRLSESYTMAVHFTHFDEVDFSEVIRLRNEMNQEVAKKGGAKLTYLPFFIKGSIAALKHFPILNSTLDTKANEVVVKHYYHYGISVQTDQGLMVAVVRDCDKKDVFQLANEIKEVADRARSGKASVQDLTGSTITITNPGNIGGLYATPVINYPESVILGMFQIKKRPVVVEKNGEDTIVARPMMFTNITCDHRIVDGAIAAGYLRLFCDYMENPAKMAFG